VKKVFISYKHDDERHFNNIKAINGNSNNRIDFLNWSLSEPVNNPYGHVNRRSPFDLYSNPVNNKVHTLLSIADKMLVLIGSNTHSSKWVDWEIKTFRKLKGDFHTLLMRVKDDCNSGCPSAAGGLPIVNWDMDKLREFIEK